jgi:hypothetical protein
MSQGCLKLEQLQFAQGACQSQANPFTISFGQDSIIFKTLRQDYG